ncbi:DUF6631 family protein [Rhodanobacter ginsengisoli]|uniref:DUF6631 family protein n=1 Tax=Rhodanobacter ginsengisoli TaxID=418646 RepID=A0ABW0QNM9_9GAMM
MARKVTPKKTARPDEGRNDVAVMHPELSLPIDGRVVVVHEYGFTQGLRVRARAKALVSDLQASIEVGEALTEDMMDVLATHGELLKDLMAESLVRLPPEADAEAIASALAIERAWVGQLGDADGNLLLSAWWGVCGPFFVRQVARRISQTIQLRGPRAGPTSTSPSPPPDTEPPPSSAGTPSDS